MIKFCDKDINYDDNFRLSITTKMPNPHYLPEICIKVTIINFTVTFEGLEEQMLVDVVMQEKPEVEIQRRQLAINLANLKTQIVEIEKKILATLANSDPDTILDSDTLINVLKDSKNSSNDIKVQLESATQIEENNTLT